jgi:ribose/xylose/arabinose/galactoside ABC-type transport system permease subunit
MTTLTAYLQARMKIVVTLCCALLAAIAAASLLADTQHAHTWAERHIPFSWSLFGFAAAALIIGAARWFGRSGIQAPADAYDRTLLPCEEEE